MSRQTAEIPLALSGDGAVMAEIDRAAAAFEKASASGRAEDASWSAFASSANEIERAAAEGRRVIASAGAASPGSLGASRPPGDLAGLSSPGAAATSFGASVPSFLAALDRAGVASLFEESP